MTAFIGRREFITLLGGATAAWPLAARAQPVRNAPIVGLVSIGASPNDPANLRPFLEQMRELGYVDGQNIVFERRFAAGDDGLIKDFVADFVRRQVDIIVATGTREVAAAKQATSSIPIVTFITPDPIGMGFAQSELKKAFSVDATEPIFVSIDPYTNKFRALVLSVHPGDFGCPVRNKNDPTAWKREKCDFVIRWDGSRFVHKPL